MTPTEYAERLVSVIERTLAGLRLYPPRQYALKERNGLWWLDCVFDVAAAGRTVEVYERAAHTVGAAIGRPVYTSNHVGMRYGILLSPKPRLPQRVDLPSDGVTLDVFRLGVSLRGEVTVSARAMVNALIGASQGAGKSNVMHLFAHQALAFGWKLYLADPQSHTFNPDRWNGLAAMAVAGSVDDLRKVLDAVEGALADRVAQFRTAAQTLGLIPADLDAYNAQIETPLPRIGLLVDEANTYLVDRRILQRLADLARQARKFGIHLVLAGHDWRAQDVPRELSAMLPTRIALAVADSTSARVVLDNERWGKWLIGKPPGRGVLKLGQFVPMQFYLAGDLPQGEHVLPLMETERQIAEKALAETGGKISLDVLMGWGLGQREARRLQDAWKSRGWAEIDPARRNGLYITSKLTGLIDKLTNSTNLTNCPETADKLTNCPDKLTN
jgi:hypothetical protein